MQPEEEIIKRWSGSAPFWEKHREVIREMFAPVTQALVEEAQIGTGQTVLDIATGPGEPALSLAALVGPEGKVFGIDPIAGMIEAARRAAEGPGLKNVKFEVAAADQLPFAADTFDAVVCRFGAMFFPSPVDAAREILRVLKPGRKMALAVWHFAEENPFHHLLSFVIDRHIPPAPVDPDALETFRFAPTGKLQKVLNEAGAVAVSERLLRFAIQAPISAEDFWAIRLEMSNTLREKIASLSKEQLAEVNREALGFLREYSTEGGMSFPAEVNMVSGAKEGR
ncbi:MAG TPA: class I SAM-dependent methyltransferase [Candidatus Acidoferrum sp.]|jgi:ubiquinone/menaquinone biosynthesis C-methylase UbiE